MICPKCHEAELAPFKEGSVAGVVCPKCKMSWVTTEMDPIREDQTLYSLSIAAGNVPERERLKTLSSVLSCNYLRAKVYLEDGLPDAITGSAVEIGAVRDRLKAASVRYTITPIFPY